MRISETDQSRASATALTWRRKNWGEGARMRGKAGQFWYASAGAVQVVTSVFPYGHSSPASREANISVRRKPEFIMLSNVTTTYISSLPDFSLESPIAVRAERITNGYLATDELVSRSAVGKTRMEALTGVAEAIQALYSVLIRKEGRLSERSAQDLTRLKSVIVHNADIDDMALLRRIYQEMKEEERALAQEGLESYAKGLEAIDNEP